MDSQTLAESGDSETVIDLGVGYAPVPDQPLKLELEVEELELTDTDETYQVEVQESDDNETFVSTGLVLAITEVGDIAKWFTSTLRYVKLAWTLGGTTPSVTASAYLSK
jgi:hypothetical protein